MESVGPGGGRCDQHQRI